MAVTVGNIVANVDANVTGFLKGMEKIQQELSKLVSGAQAIRVQFDDRELNSSIKRIDRNLEYLTTRLEQALVGVVRVFDMLDGKLGNFGSQFQSTISTVATGARNAVTTESNVIFTTVDRFMKRVSPLVVSSLLGFSNIIQNIFTQLRIGVPLTFNSIFGYVEAGKKTVTSFSDVFIAFAGSVLNFLKDPQISGLGAVVSKTAGAMSSMLSTLTGLGIGLWAAQKAINGILGRVGPPETGVVGRFARLITIIDKGLLGLNVRLDLIRAKVGLVTGVLVTSSALISGLTVSFSTLSSAILPVLGAFTIFRAAWVGISARIRLTIMRIRAGLGDGRAQFRLLLLGFRQLWPIMQAMGDLAKPFAKFLRSGMIGKMATRIDKAMKLLSSTLPKILNMLKQISDQLEKTFIPMLDKGPASLDKMDGKVDSLGKKALSTVTTLGKGIKDIGASVTRTRDDVESVVAQGKSGLLGTIVTALKTGAGKVAGATAKSPFAAASGIAAAGTLGQIAGVLPTVAGFGSLELGLVAVATKVGANIFGLVKEQAAGFFTSMKTRFADTFVPPIRNLMSTLATPFKWIGVKVAGAFKPGGTSAERIDKMATATTKTARFGLFMKDALMMAVGALPGLGRTQLFSSQRIAEERKAAIKQREEIRRQQLFRDQRFQAVSGVRGMEGITTEQFMKSLLQRGKALEAGGEKFGAGESFEDTVDRFKEFIEKGTELQKADTKRIQELAKRFAPEKDLATMRRRAEVFFKTRTDSKFGTIEPEVLEAGQEAGGLTNRISDAVDGVEDLGIVVQKYLGGELVLAANEAKGALTRLVTGFQEAEVAFAEAASLMSGASVKVPARVEENAAKALAGVPGITGGENLRQVLGALIGVGTVAGRGFTGEKVGTLNQEKIMKMAIRPGSRLANIASAGLSGGLLAAIQKAVEAGGSRAGIKSILTRGDVGSPGQLLDLFAEISGKSLKTLRTKAGAAKDPEMQRSFEAIKALQETFRPLRDVFRAQKLTRQEGETEADFAARESSRLRSITGGVKKLAGIGKEDFTAIRRSLDIAVTQAIQGGEKVTANKIKKALRQMGSKGGEELLAGIMGFGKKIPENLSDMLSEKGVQKLGKAMVKLTESMAPYIEHSSPPKKGPLRRAELSLSKMGSTLGQQMMKGASGGKKSVDKFVSVMFGDLEHKSPAGGRLGMIERSFGKFGAVIGERILSGKNFVQQSITDLFRAGFSGIPEVVGSIVGDIIELPFKIASKVVGTIGSVITGAITGLTKILTIPSQMLSGLLGALPFVGDLLAGPFKLLTGVITGLGDAVAGLAKMISSTIVNAISFAGKAIGGFAKLGGKAISSLLKLLLETNEAIVQIGRSAEQLDIPVKSFDVLTKAVQQYGVSSDELAQSLLTLRRSMNTVVRGEGSDMLTLFSSLGIGIDDIRNKRVDEIFLLMVDELGKSNISAAKLERGLDALGAGFGRMLNVVKRGGPELRELIDTVNFEGGLIDEATVERSERIFAMMTRLGQLFERLKRVVFDALSPILDKLLTTMDDKAPAFFKRIEHLIPAVMDSAEKIVNFIGDYGFTVFLSKGVQLLADLGRKAIALVKGIIVSETGGTAGIVSNVLSVASVILDALIEKIRTEIANMASGLARQLRAKAETSGFVAAQALGAFADITSAVSETARPEEKGGVGMISASEQAEALISYLAGDEAGIEAVAKKAKETIDNRGSVAIGMVDSYMEHEKRVEELRAQIAEQQKAIADRREKEATESGTEDFLLSAILGANVKGGIDALSEAAEEDVNRLKSLQSELAFTLSERADIDKRAGLFNEAFAKAKETLELFASVTDKQVDAENRLVEATGDAAKSGFDLNKFFDELLGNTPEATAAFDELTAAIGDRFSKALADANSEIVKSNEEFVLEVPETSPFEPPPVQEIKTTIALLPSIIASQRKILDVESSRNQLLGDAAKMRNAETERIREGIDAKERLNDLTQQEISANKALIEGLVQIPGAVTKFSLEKDGELVDYNIAPDLLDSDDPAVLAKMQEFVQTMSEVLGIELKLAMPGIMDDAIIVAKRAINERLGKRGLVSDFLGGFDFIQQGDTFAGDAARRDAETATFFDQLELKLIDLQANEQFSPDAIRDIARELDVEGQLTGNVAEDIKLLREELILRRDRARTRQQVMEGVAQPVSGAMATTLKSVYDGSLTEAINDARKKARAAGQEFHQWMFITSRIAQQILDSIVDNLIAKATETTTRLLADLTQDIFGVTSDVAAGLATGLLGAGAAILANLDSSANVVKDTVDSAVESTESIRGLISGETTVKLKEVGEQLREANQPIVERLDVMIGIMRGGASLGAPGGLDMQAAVSGSN